MENNTGNLEDQPISKSEFIRILARGSPQGLVNDNNAPVNLLIHPLLYSPDLNQFPDLQCVPLLYEVERGFADAYKEVRR